MTKEQRESIEARLEANARQAASLFERCPLDALVRRPRAGAWSAVDCVEHLSLTAAATLPLIEATVARAREHAVRSESPSRMDWLGRLLRWALEPGRFRTRTSVPFQPQPAGSPAEVLAGFMKWHTRTVSVLRQAEGLDLSAATMTSPFDRRIRYNGYAAFRILETHERRHLLQAAQAADASL